jgi:hypothetical protein
MRFTRWVTAAAGLGCLLLTGCETAGQPGGQSTTPPATSASPTGGGQGDYPGPCPVGTWQLGNLQTSTSVNGGELTFSGGGSLKLTMDADGTWELSDDGSQPLSTRLAASGVSTAGTVTIRGSAEGNYTKTGDQYAFQVESTQGSAELKSDVLNQTYDMDQVTSALVPSGEAAVSCTGTTLRINSGAFDMSWNYAGGAPGGGSGTAAPTPTTGQSGGDVVVSTAGTHDCSGRNVKINGSSLTVSLTGNCATVEVNGSTNNVDVASAESVLVNGSANTVDAMLVARIEARGSRNTIKWGASPSGGEPTIETTGVGNQIQQG